MARNVKTLFDLTGRAALITEAARVDLACRWHKRLANSVPG